LSYGRTFASLSPSATKVRGACRRNYLHTP